MTDSKSFWKSFSYRSVLCFVLAITLFFITVLRLAAAATDKYAEVQAKQNRLRLKIANQRGTIYDNNLVPITNNAYKIIAAVSPTPRAVTAISAVLSGDELQNVLEKLKGGKPVLCEVPQEIKCDGIVCTKIYENSDSNTPAIHLIGYTDTDGKGVTGLQAAYDSILYSENEISLSYECDGKGKVLEGLEPELEYSSEAASNAVVSTLDINIQSIAENQAKNLELGAIVIADAKTSKIRACVSRPYFDCLNVSDYLQQKDSPLLNRAINAYCVGSVFKPCVAAAGIDSKLKNFSYICTGSCEIIDRFFNCHKRDGHGKLNLCSAIANSCNTYFYNYAFKIGKNAIYKTAKNLSFGESLPLCNEISTVKGNLPSLESLENIAHLANFSIGQGELITSPVSMLNLYCSIATDGKYYIPSVVEGTYQKGRYQEYDIGNPTRAMESDTAAALREYLSAVLSEGTGQDAMPKNVSAAGKTATAQTGRFENGIEICQGWFCGFFPAENPQYVAIVFSENIKRQSLSCAEIFANLADQITQLKRIN